LILFQILPGLIIPGVFIKYGLLAENLPEAGKASRLRLWL